MKRRDVLSLGAVASLTTLSGCLSSNPLQADAAFTYTPPSPVVGENIVFDGSKSNASEWEWFFDKSPGLVNYDASGKKVTHTFEESGAHTVTLRATAPFGIIPGPNLDRTTKTVYVEEQGASSDKTVKPISTSTDQISLHLRGVTTRITADETAILQFSAVNLDSEQNLSIRLALKLPSGMTIRGASLIRSGNGQYSTTFDVSPGETAGTSIRLGATRTGRFSVEGIANYSFDGGDEQTRRGTIPIIVTDSQSG